MSAIQLAPTPRRERSDPMMNNQQQQQPQHQHGLIPQQQQGIGQPQQDVLRLRGNHSQAYLKGEIDTIDVIRAKLDPVGFEGYCFGMIHKRLHRAAAMRPDEHEAKYADWVTAAFYLNQLLRTAPPAQLGPTADRLIRQSDTGDFLAAFDRLAVGGSGTQHARTQTAAGAVPGPIAPPPRAGEPQQQR